MHRHLTIVALLVLLSAGVVSARADSANTIPYVYRIKIGECEFYPEDFYQTGFRVQNTAGIVTALHGVADCKTINAVSDDGREIYNNLTIRQVDIARDIALVSSSQLDGLPTDGLAASALTESDIVGAVFRVAGYPVGLEKQSIDANVHIRGIRSLDDVIPDDVETTAFLKRGSPDIHIDVIDVEGHLLPGHSGAPLLDPDCKVLGVGDGGLGSGSIEHGWAIPWHDVDLLSVELPDVKDGLDRLAANDPSLAFSFSNTYRTTPTMGGAPHDLVGLVVDKVTQQPIRGAEVTLTFRDEAGNYSGYVKEDTDSQGAFVFKLREDMAGTLAELQVERQGYQTAVHNLLGNKLPPGKIGLTPNPSPVPETTETATVCEIGLIVYDARTLDPIKGAQVRFVYYGAPRADLADSEGYVSFRFVCDEPYPTVDIRVTSAGYEPVHRTIQFAGGTERIYLEKSPTVTPTDTSVPAPVATPTPGPPTYTPTATPALDFDAAVAIDGLVNLRDGPGTDYGMVGYVKGGDRLLVLAKNPAEDWVRVVVTTQSGKPIGWVSVSLIDLYVSLAEVPTVYIPTPTITPTPTPTRTESVGPTPPPLRLLGAAGQGANGDEVTTGETTFGWQYTGTLAPNQAFEVCVLQGNELLGLHDAANTRKDHTITTLGNVYYFIEINIACLRNIRQSGLYQWTVRLVEIAPDYAPLDIQADPGWLYYDGPSSCSD